MKLADAAAIYAGADAVSAAYLASTLLWTPPSLDVQAVTLVGQRAVQTASGSTNAPSAAITAATTVGDVLVMRFFANADVTGVTDSRGNTWTVDVKDHGTIYMGFASCTVETAHVAGDTIALNLAANTSYHGFVIDEWSGVNATSRFGGASAALVSTTEAARETDPVTVPDGALVFGMWVCNGTDATFTADTGYTAFPIYAGQGSPQHALDAAYQIAADAGTFAPSGTGANQHYDGLATYYKAAPA
jgi:hypothetical protein